MARQARSRSSTNYYHVMIRGINKQHIFKNDRDKAKFQELLKKQQDDQKIKITAWCIMSNHVHLILHADIKDMSYAIKVSSGMYVNYFNKKYDRVGPLFSNRYKSKCIETDEYLICNLRYIHNNPVEASIVDCANIYKWSSYNEYINERVFINDDEKDFILKYFNNNINRYINFHTLSDERIYLDLKEHQDERLYKICYSLRQEYIKEYSITSAKQLHLNNSVMSELSYRLVKEYGLSLRKAAKLLETNFNAVDRAVKNYDKLN